MHVYYVNIVIFLRFKIHQIEVEKKKMILTSKNNSNGSSSNNNHKCAELSR